MQSRTLIVEVARTYVRSTVPRNAARIAYYAFFSIFPLLLAFVAILGFVLEGNPQARRDILDSALAETPVVGAFIRNDIGQIGGSGIALATGVALALWAGLGITTAVSDALDEIWGGRPLGYVTRKVRGLATLAIVAAAIVASAIVGGAAASGRIGGTATSVAAVVLSMAVDAVALLATFRLLTAARPPFGDLLPGVAVGVAGLIVLQALGGWYVRETINRATDTYGLFATVIGLLSYLSLLAHLLLVSATTNAVVARERGQWPPASSRAPER